MRGSMTEPSWLGRVIDPSRPTSRRRSSAGVAKSTWMPPITIRPSFEVGATRPKRGATARVQGCEGELAPLLAVATGGENGGGLAGSGAAGAGAAAGGAPDTGATPDGAGGGGAGAGRGGEGAGAGAGCAAARAGARRSVIAKAGVRIDPPQKVWNVVATALVPSEVPPTK